MATAVNAAVKPSFPPKPAPKPGKLNFQFINKHYNFVYKVSICLKEKKNQRQINISNYMHCNVQCLRVSHTSSPKSL